LKNILNTTEFDAALYILLLFVVLLIYTFVFNGFVTSSIMINEAILYYYSLIIGALESFVFGVLFSAILDEIHLNITGYPTIIDWLVENFIYKFLPFLQQWDAGVHEAISSSIAIIVLAVYLYLYNGIINFIGGGLFSLSLPFILSFMIYFLIPQYNENYFKSIQ